MHLLVFAVAVSAVAPRVLAGARWVYRSPRLGIAAWYAVLGAVVTAVAGAAVTMMAPWRAADAPICMAWRWCVQAAHGQYGAAGRVAAFAAVLATVALALRLILTVIRLSRAAAVRRREHRRLLAVAGRPAPELGATVVEHAQPAAYVVAGSGRRVVITSGALDQLRDDEVAAVLAHERAHAAGRHDLLLDGVRVLHHAFPRMALFAVARVQLCRLVELRADEVATRRHAPISLARALVAMATASADVRPGGLLIGVGATGGDAVERLHRLLTPPAPLARLHTLAVATAVAALAVAPAALLAATLVYPVLGMCPAPPA